MRMKTLMENGKKERKRERDSWSFTYHSYIQTLIPPSYPQGYPTAAEYPHLWPGGILWGRRDDEICSIDGA